MVIAVNESLTRQVAHLARLELSDAEVATFTTQLGEILNYVDQLQKVDVKGIDPLTHPLELNTPMREDKVLEFPKDEEGKPGVLKSAPEIFQDGFKVPQII